MMPVRLWAFGGRLTAHGTLAVPATTRGATWARTGPPIGTRVEMPCASEPQLFAVALRRGLALA
jgi:hypothetical protein